MHRTLLGADIRAYPYRQLMCLENGVPCKHRSGKGTCEAVTRAYRICDFHLGRLQEALIAPRKDVTPVHTTSEDDQLQVVVLKQAAASLLNSHGGESEELGDDVQLLVVNLQNVAGKQAVVNEFFRIELLTKVDIEDPQAVLGSMPQEFPDGVAAYFATLSQ